MKGLHRTKKKLKKFLFLLLKWFTVQGRKGKERKELLRVLQWITAPVQANKTNQLEVFFFFCGRMYHFSGWFVAMPWACRFFPTAPSALDGLCSPRWQQDSAEQPKLPECGRATAAMARAHHQSGDASAHLARGLNKRSLLKHGV